MMVERLFLSVPRGCLQFVIVVVPDHTHLLFCTCSFRSERFPDLVKSCVLVEILWLISGSLPDKFTCMILSRHDIITSSKELLNLHETLPHL